MCLSVVSLDIGRRSPSVVYVSSTAVCCIRVFVMYIFFLFFFLCICHFFFFQAEDGIRDLVRSRGLGDVYKRQAQTVHAGVPQPRNLPGKRRQSLS